MFTCKCDSILFAKRVKDLSNIRVIVMADTVVNDKISETILNIVKRGNIFTKIKKVEKLVYGCTILLSIFGCSILSMCFLNTRLYITNYNAQKKQLDNLQDTLDRLLYTDIDIPKSISKTSSFTNISSVTFPHEQIQ